MPHRLQLGCSSQQVFWVKGNLVLARKKFSTSCGGRHHSVIQNPGYALPNLILQCSCGIPGSCCPLLFATRISSHLSCEICSMCLVVLSHKCPTRECFQITDIQKFTCNYKLNKPGDFYRPKRPLALLEDLTLQGSTAYL